MVWQDGGGQIVRGRDVRRRPLRQLLEKPTTVDGGSFINASVSIKANYIAVVGVCLYFGSSQSEVLGLSSLSARWRSTMEAWRVPMKHSRQVPKKRSSRDDISTHS